MINEIRECLKKSGLTEQEYETLVQYVKDVNVPNQNFEALGTFVSLILQNSDYLVTLVQRFMSENELLEQRVEGLENF